MRSQRTVEGTYRLEVPTDDGDDAVVIERPTLEEAVAVFRAKGARNPNDIGPRYHRLRHHFSHRFPDAFPPRGQQCVPLKHGIIQDMVIAGEALEDVRWFVGIWCQRWEYLDAVIGYAHRIDLLGRARGIVTSAEVGTALAKIEEKRWHRAELHRRAA